MPLDILLQAQAAPPLIEVLVRLPLLRQRDVVVEVRDAQHGVAARLHQVQRHVLVARAAPGKGRRGLDDALKSLTESLIGLIKVLKVLSLVLQSALIRPLRAAPRHSRASLRLRQSLDKAL